MRQEMILDNANPSGEAPYIRGNDDDNSSILKNSQEFENTSSIHIDTEVFIIDNFVAISYQNRSLLKQHGLVFNDSDLNIKFAELTKRIFIKLGFTADENLREFLNEDKHQIDIVLNLGGGNIMILECQTFESEEKYDFCSTLKKVKSYARQAERNGYNVVKSIFVAPEFSETFVKKCNFENKLSLVTSASLVKILESINTPVVQ